MEFASLSRSEVGESPLWSVADQTLLWVDLRGRCVRRLDARPTGAGEIDPVPTPELAAAVFPMARGGLVCAMESGVFGWCGPGTEWCKVVAAPHDLQTDRFNDATVDPVGRLIITSMRKVEFGAQPTGALWAFDGRDWRRLLDGLWTGNGLAFAPDGRTLYVSDSHPGARWIRAASYNPSTGLVGPWRLFSDYAGLDGRPDGAAVDAEGSYWSAAVGGGCLHRFASDGQYRDRLDLPVENPTKPAFGGEYLMTLYVTSMRARLTRPDPGGLAGALLQGSAGVAGLRVPALAFAGPWNDTESAA